MSLIPVVLSGGSGTRLWPLSRKLMPKQFLPLTGEASMMQATLHRLRGMDGLTVPVVVCNEDHRFTVAEQLRHLGMGHQGILLEPSARNTAPAIAVAAIHALRSSDSDPLLLVLPADHVIQNVPAFHQAIAVARSQAEQGALVTFGIVPTTPHTGYGYIRAEGAGSLSLVPGALERETKDKTQITKHQTAYPVTEFVEKPDLPTAERYVTSSEYFWNSGMFMFKASRYLEELTRFNPEMVTACEKAVSGASTDLDFVRLERAAFDQCPEDSIDYAVMEKTDRAVVVPLDAAWSDVGSWSALWEIGEKDDADNVLVGDVLSIGSKGCYARSDNHLVALIGVEDLVVVDTPDALMVAHRERSQDVKKIVDLLKRDGRSEAVVHREVFRPWGKYDSIDMGTRFQVKRITVNPGASLSLQKHHHRAEHWIVVSGTAEVTCDDKVLLLGENQSTYIPLGSVHRLANPGKIPLEMIEVQSGSYLGEDDIVRFEDVYGRGEEKKA
ncbi:MAG: mannose-1-phosphate guanylyltransferase/mannose-6-phosphate isomerase [Thermodesulfobacteriota bacterium]